MTDYNTEEFESCGDHKIHFGKHSGTFIKDLSIGYLRWAVKNNAGNKLERIFMYKYLYYLDNEHKTR